MEEEKRISEEELKKDVAAAEARIRKTDDFTSPEELYGELIASVKKYHPSDDISLIEKAYRVAADAHKDQKRKSGEPYIIHPLCVAIILADLELDKETIVAGLLHDVVEDTGYTVEDIRNLFGDKIASLVDGLTKIKTVLDNEDRKGNNNMSSTESMQAENFKRILLTLNDDVRVVLIKLADRLHNCRTIEFMPEHKRDKILSETMFIFIPLAHRLGLYGVKSEMENIWLKHKEPEDYKTITELINRDSANRSKDIDEFIEPISAALEKMNLKFSIKKRIKTPYSIWYKMHNKHVPFEQIFDLYAVRIVFTPKLDGPQTERDQAYLIFSTITNLYRENVSRRRDWIAQPKNNGYEVLHCTLMSDTGIWIEVQIRSKRMDDIAEKGIAAHWTYKQEGYISENDSEMDKWLAKIKEILVNPDVNALELLDIIHNDLTSSEITVFTPKGEQKSIVKGSTALDFAYNIHTEIGNKAIAAKVNMKLVPLSHVLKSGDQVEIITAELEHPKKEWLQFLQTRHARNMVIDYFKGQKKEIAELGKKMLADHLESLGYRMNNDTIGILINHFSIPGGNVEEMFFRIGIGTVKLGADLPEVLASGKADRSHSWSFPWFGKKRMSVKKENDGYTIATCCRPIPGDPVIGIKSPDGTVTVHKKSCPVADSIASKHGDWVVVPQWEDDEKKSFLARLSINGLDRVGLLNEISRYITLVMGVNIRKICLSSEEGIFSGYIDLYVHDKAVLERMIRKLSSIDGIKRVVRTEI